MMELLDLGLRSACMGVALVVTAKFIATARLSRESWFVFLIFVTSASGTFVSSSIAAGLAHNSEDWELFIKILAVTGTGMYLYAWRGNANPQYRPNAMHIVLMVFFVLASLLWIIDSNYEKSILVVALTLCIGTTYSAYFMDTSDLPDAQVRRRRRSWPAAMAILFTLVFSRLWYGFFSLPMGVHIVEAAVLFTGTSVHLWPLLKIHGASPGKLPVHPYQKSTKLSARDENLRTRLESDEIQEILTQRNLTIGKLATAMNAPEHQLRKMINQGLGYSNFNAYLNRQRIRKAQIILSDPSMADLSIAKLAYDLGFASIGPFNRAFRQLTGESPSSYRKRHTSS